MRYREATGVNVEAVGVRYLGQSFNELLYDYSPASYKPRVMGIEGLCDEALQLVAQIDSQLIDRARIDSVLEEIEHVVKTDPVAKNLIDFEVNYYTSFPKDSDLLDLKVRLGLLWNKVSNGKYIQALQNKIIEVCSDDRQKKVIYQAARRWISALNFSGYSVQFIRDRVDAIFHASETQIFSEKDLVHFFQSFSFEPEKFDVVFLASAMIREVSDVARKFGAEVISEGHSLFESLVSAGLECKHGDAFVYFSEINSYDHFSARASTERSLEHISDLFVLFHHKTKILWYPGALVRKVDSAWKLIVPPNPSVKRVKDNIPNKAAKKLNAVFNNLSFTDNESVGRFISVVRLHGSALESVSAEARLVNIWTALEVLVHRESDSKLKAVIRLLTPFLIHGYIDSLLYALAGDLYRWNRKQFYEILKIDELKGWKIHHRLAAVLLGGVYESRRSDLYENISSYALLCNRCFSISQLISSGTSLDDALKEHERRVIWQIRRIFRSRNLIVHDGSTPQYLDALTENAHEYLDAFIGRFLALCTRSMSATTLEEAVVFQAKLYDQWRKEVSSCQNVSLDSVKKVCALDALA